MKSETAAIRLYSDFVREARQSGVRHGRSAAEQIQFWVRLGRATEGVLSGASTVSLLNLGRLTEVQREPHQEQP
jgi:hypothetical protein